MQDWIKRSWAVRIFLLVCAAAIGLSVCSMLVNADNASDSIFFGQCLDNHMDFFNTVKDNATMEVYENGTIYPPLINLAYHAVSKLFPDIGGMSARELSQTARGTIVYYVIQLLGVALCLLGCWWNTDKLRIWERIGILFAVLLSAPMLFVMERGNSIIYAVALILLFMKTVSLPDDRKELHELGLIALAVAANIKFYPAIFGMILIKKKRYQETVRCVLYGLALFVIPLFFYGGFHALKRLLGSIAGSTTTLLSVGLGYKIGWHNFGEIVSRTVGISIPIDINSFLTALVLVGLFLCRSDGMVYWGCAMLCVGFPLFSYNYNALYMLMPICMFLSESGFRQGGSKPKLFLMIAISILLALTIAPFAVGGYAPFDKISVMAAGEWQQLNVTTLVCCVSVTLLGALYIVEAIQDHKKIGIVA